MQGWGGVGCGRNSGGLVFAGSRLQQIVNGNLPAKQALAEVVRHHGETVSLLADASHKLLRQILALLLRLYFVQNFSTQTAKIEVVNIPREKSVKKIAPKKRVLTDSPDGRLDTRRSLRSSRNNCKTEQQPGKLLMKLILNSSDFNG